MDDRLGAALRGRPGAYLRSPWPRRAWAWCAQAGLAGGIVLGLGAAAVVPVATGVWRLTTVGGVLLEALMLLLVVGAAVAVGAWQRRALGIVRSPVPGRYPLPLGPAAPPGRRIRHALRAPGVGDAVLRDVLHAAAFLPVAAVAGLMAFLPVLGPIAVDGLETLVAGGPGGPVRTVLHVLVAVALTASAPWVWGWTALAALHLTAALTGVGRDRAAALEHGRRASRRRLSGAFESERKRIERDLHDGPQQRILAQTLTLALAADELRSLGAPAASALALVEQARGESRAVLAELRDLVRAIHPQVLTDAGLAAALDEVLSRFPLPVDARITCPPAMGRPDALVESTAYFVVLEALSNAVKHGGRPRVTLAVRLDDTDLHVLVQDDGPGGARLTPGGGLAGLADRVEAVAGTFRMQSPAGGPTVLRVDLPRRPQALPVDDVLEGAHG